jgi:hypothetical protein
VRIRQGEPVAPPATEFARGLRVVP